MLRMHKLSCAWVLGWVCLAGYGSLARSADTEQGVTTITNDVHTVLKAYGSTVTTDEKRSYSAQTKAPSGIFTQKEEAADSNVTRTGAIGLNPDAATAQAFGLPAESRALDLLRQPDANEMLMLSLPDRTKQADVPKLVKQSRLLVVECLCLQETGTRGGAAVNNTLAVVRLKVDGVMMEVWKRAAKQPGGKTILASCEVKSWNERSMGWGGIGAH